MQPLNIHIDLEGRKSACGSLSTARCMLIMNELLYNEYLKCCFIGDYFCTVNTEDMIYIQERLKIENRDCGVKFIYTPKIQYAIPNKAALFKLVSFLIKYIEKVKNDSLLYQDVLARALELYR